MTELSFLLDLFLDDECPTVIRTKLTARIKEVEASLSFKVIQQPSYTEQKKQQVASTLEAMARHDATISIAATQPAIIAQTEATSIAMASRNQAISEALSGKINKDTGRPRKF